MYVTEFKSAFYMYYVTTFAFYRNNADTHSLSNLFELERLMYENMQVKSFNRGE